jgi:hypothetical protein
MSDTDTQLLNERIHRALDLVEGRFLRLEAEQLHSMELLIQRVEALERSQADQEARLRTVADGVIRLNAQGSLTAIGQSLLSLILAAIAAYIGAR